MNHADLDTEVDRLDEPEMAVSTRAVTPEQHLKRSNVGESTPVRMVGRVGRKPA